MEYTILWASFMEKLVSMVNTECQKGWMPLGGVAIALTTDAPYSPAFDGQYRFFQAMMRTTPPTAQQEPFPKFNLSKQMP